MLNRIIMTGRLTRDPELRTTQSNISVTSFSIANQRNYKNGNGERVTDFFDVVAWRATAEFVTKYFVKGSLVTVDGRAGKPQIHRQAGQRTQDGGNHRG